NLCRTKRIADCADLFVGFQFAVRPKWIGLWTDADFHFSKLIRQMNGKYGRDFQTLDVHIGKDLDEDLRRSRKWGAAVLPSLLIMRISEHLIDCRLAFRSIEFQIVHHQIPLA